MRKAVFAWWHWLLLETEAGVGWLITNIFGLGRTIVGVLIEIYILQVPSLNNLAGRFINTFYDQGTDLFLQTLRKKMKEKRGWDKGWKAFAFDTVFLTVIKVPVYITCLGIAGVPWYQLRWMLLVNILMFLVSARLNCIAIDKVLEKNKKT